MVLEKSSLSIFPNLPKYTTKVVLSQGFELKSIWFSSFLNDHSDFILPTSTSLQKISLNLNVLIDNLPSITHLILGSFFNQNVDYLPPSLLHLEFGYQFDQPIDHLPLNLQSLKFPFFGKFNQFVDHLPNSLKVIVFSGSFNRPLDNLPTSLKSLYINYLTNKPFNTGLENYLFNQALDHLPTSLSVLKINLRQVNYSMDNLPPNLKILWIESRKDSLILQQLGYWFPKSLRSLHLPFHYLQDEEEYDILDHLPNLVEIN